MGEIRYFYCPGCREDHSAHTFEEAAREIARHIRKKCINLEQATEIVSTYCDDLNKNQVKFEIEIQLDKLAELERW